jgi:hypothetical protein
MARHQLGCASVHLAMLLAIAIMLLAYRVPGASRRDRLSARASPSQHPPRRINPALENSVAPDWLARAQDVSGPRDAGRKRSHYVVREMFGDGFEQATILRTGPDGFARVIVRRVVQRARIAARRGRRRRENYHASSMVRVPPEGARVSAVVPTFCSGNLRRVAESGRWARPSCW